MVRTRPKWWLSVGVVFVIINFVGGILAAFEREPMHAATHFALTVAGYYFVRGLVRKGSAAAQLPAGDQAIGLELSAGLTHLQQSVDAIAEEVSRISEGQRSITRLFNERGRNEESERA